LEVVASDTTFAIFSVLFVYVYFIVHLRSVFLATMGIFMIISSFPVTAVINAGIFRNTYYSALHSVLIFIVLGIGADDIFVFVDGWRHSATIEEIRDNPNQRLAYSFRRAARATATTSSTTSVAFLANGFCPLMPMKSLGIYAAILIVVNYVLIIIVLPPVMMFYD